MPSYLASFSKLKSPHIIISSSFFPYMMGWGLNKNKEKNRDFFSFFSYLSSPPPPQSHHLRHHIHIVNDYHNHNHNFIIVNYCHDFRCNLGFLFFCNNNVTSYTQKRYPKMLQFSPISYIKVTVCNNFVT